MLAKKINEYCKANKVKHEIEAMPTALAQQNYQKFDIFLIAPQVRFLEKTYKNLVGNKPVRLIPPIVYGRLDIKGILDIVNQK